MTEIKRKGDKVKIDGAYQYNAIKKGNTFQRNWHILKLQAAVALANILPTDKILDTGCGSGVLVSFLPQHIQNYVGVDANIDAVRFAQKTFTADNRSFGQFQIDDLAEMAAASFTKIFFLETIEHITSQQGANALQQFHRLLAPGGICIISTPNKKSLWPMLEWGLDFLRLTPPLKDGQHEKLYSITELKEIGIQAGFIIKEIKTMNAIAPWLSFFGQKTTIRLHNWEMANNWLPGSLIILALEKKAAQ